MQQYNTELQQKIDPLSDGLAAFRAVLAWKLKLWKLYVQMK